MDSISLMEFSMLEDEENMAPPLTQTPVVKNSILKPSNKDNLIQLTTPVHKNLKVKFQTPQPKKVSPTRYEQIRELDDKENWSERTTVVLKSDHEENVKNAQTILLNLLDRVIDSCEAKTHSLAASDETSSSDDKSLDTTLTEEGTETQHSPNVKENKPTENNEERSSSPVISNETGAYTIDLDNVDNVDPFKSSGGLALSPANKPPTKSNESDDKLQQQGLVENLDDIKLEDIADITLPENITLGGSDTGLFGDADSTVIENKGGNSADITVVENTGKKDLDNTVVENMGKNDLDNTVIEKPSQTEAEVDFDNISDPFSSKKQLMNSPQVGPTSGQTVNPFAALKEDAIDGDVGKEDLSQETTDNPSVSKAMVANSPVCDKSEVNSTKSKQVKDEENPFTTKSNVANSPQVTDPFATKSNVANSPKTDGDPYVTNTKLENSPGKTGEVENNSAARDLKTPTKEVEKSLSSAESKIAPSHEASAEENPFMTKSKVANSPALELEEKAISVKSPAKDEAGNPEENPFATKCKMPNSPAVKGEDPFATKSKVPNSPAPMEGDPFSTKSKVPNSPAFMEGDPFTTKSKVPNSPAFTEGDPFTTKSKVPNSPALTEGDPFTTKSKVPNSPAPMEGNPFTTKSKVPNSPAPMEGDPFTTKSKVPNSPAPMEGDPFTTKSKVPNSPAPMEGDPFTTKSKVPNSPAPMEGDPFTTKSKVPNSPAPMEGDPFTTKSKVPNSPAPMEGDPFTTKSKVPNSPAPMEGDPFTTKSKVPNSPAPMEGDPFATKSKVPNSPAISGEDPFATKSKVPNSPGGNAEDNPFVTKSKVNQSPLKEDLDPFATKATVSNSPPVGSDVDPFVTKSKVPVSPKNEGQGQKTKGDNSAEKITSRAPAATNNIDAFGIDEDQFKPASDVFNDTAAWDALENFGSTTNDASSTLSRQSLYVKFDPLVDLPPDDLRRQSIVDFRRASMKLERLRELNSAEDSFMLFGTPPKVSSVRNVGVVPPSVVDGKRKTPAKTPVKVLKKEMAKDLLTDSPDLLSMSMDVSRMAKDSSDIKINMADLIQGSDTGIVQVLKYTEEDLQKIKQALLMEVQGKLLAKDRETAQIKQQYEDKLNKYREELVKRDEKAKDSAKGFDELMVILTEYEKTIDNVINEKEKLKEEKDEEIKKLKQKLEQLSSDEQSIETAFSDLHRRYDKLKGVLQGYVTNEENLKKYSDECSAKVKTTEEKMLTLKKDAEAKIKKALTEKDTLKSELEAETSKLKVALKRKEMELQGSQNQLEQKIKENTELTSLCDELLAKVK